jgi:hypothetical protein
MLDESQKLAEENLEAEKREQEMLAEAEHLSLEEAKRTGVDVARVHDAVRHPDAAASADEDSGIVQKPKCLRKKLELQGNLQGKSE